MDSMLMCLCYGISCHEIQKIVQGGIVTTEGVQNECNAGKGCGCCLEALTQMVEKEANKVCDLAMSTSHAAAVTSSSRNQCP
ncbi:(2Fe-2S)-binding protein [Silvanigrella aquatica]|uniref:(2Fe-2S)-binding protein n=1 Tax=Silvanigrella aquatica TaxID=1915309 RepID=UPI0011E5A336|nr:(2Fe-2S)-binding protein [Silvanigrella aquatica]